MFAPQRASISLASIPDVAHWLASQTCTDETLALTLFMQFPRKRSLSVALLSRWRPAPARFATDNPFEDQLDPHDRPRIVHDFFCILFHFFTDSYRSTYRRIIVPRSSCESQTARDIEYINSWENSPHEGYLDNASICIRRVVKSEENGHGVSVTGKHTRISHF